MAHAKNGPSVAPRRVLCPGSARIEAQIPGDGGSRAADLGTAVHAVIESAILDPGLDISTLIGQPWLTDSKYRSYYNVGDIAGAKIHLDYVAQRTGELFGAITYAEEKVNPERFTRRTDTNGTCDTIITGEADGFFSDSFLEIIDYKNGRTPVFPDSEQLKLYGGGALAKFMSDGDTALPFDTVRLTVVQPNMDPDGVGEWEGRVDAGEMPHGAVAIGVDMGTNVLWAEYPAAVLVEHCDQIGRAIDKCDDPHAPCIPGDKPCMFCKGKRGATPCFAYVEWNLNPPDEDVCLQALFGIDLNRPGELVDKAVEAASHNPQDFLTPEQHAALYLAARPLISMLNAITESALERHRVSPLPGLKEVEGRRGNRHWVDEDTAMVKIAQMTVVVGDKKKKIGKGPIIVEKLMSPAQLEKAVLSPITDVKTRRRLADRIGALYTQSQAKPILVAVSDEREEVRPISAEDLKPRETLVQPEQPINPFEL